MKERKTLRERNQFYCIHNMDKYELRLFTLPFKGLRSVLPMFVKEVSFYADLVLN